MINVKSLKVLSISLTLISLMLLNVFAGSAIQTVQASPDIDLYAVVTTDPFWGYYGGYHAILEAMKPELAKIGINLIIKMYDAYSWFSIVWDEKWNVPGDQGGWDFFCSEWWLMPSAPSLWLEEVIYTWLDIEQGGYNVFPYKNEKSDALMWKGLHTIDADTRQKALWDWQELSMHDCFMINIYYGMVYQIESDWLEGYDPTAWFMEPSHMFFNYTRYNQAGEPWDRWNATEQAGTCVFGGGWEPIWGFNNLYMETYNEDRLDDLKDDTLYDLTIDADNMVGYEPYTWPDTLPPGPSEYCVKPALAKELPIFSDGPNGPNTNATIKLREGVKWSDGHPFNATDVKFTYDLVLNLESAAVAYADLAPVVESVEIIDAYTIELLLTAPSPDLGNILSNEWGMAMVPYHILKDIPPGDLRTDKTNINWEDCLPALGPFMLNKTAGSEVVVDDHATLVKNPYYYGYDEDIVNYTINNVGQGPNGEKHWGPYNISEVILAIEPDATQRLKKLVNYEFNLAEYAVASIEEMEALAAKTDDYLNVYQYQYPSSHPPLWLNLNTPFLKNRYVRQAIAHAIPYPRIYQEILPSWGIEVYEVGKTFILPQHYYTDPDDHTRRVPLFNTELEPYEYNIAKAQKYMDMYNNQTNGDYTKGPIGDADQSGLVDLTDWGIWNTYNVGEMTTPIDIYPAWPYDLDPDFNNDGAIDIVNDEALWKDPGYGSEYPFAGAR